MFDAALAQGDVAWQANALLVMANCELRVTSRFRPAYEHAQRAAFLFERCGAAGSECSALGTLAIAATHLAQHEDAVESSLLGVQHAQSLPPGIESVMSACATSMPAGWAMPCRRSMTWRATWPSANACCRRSPATSASRRPVTGTT